MDVVHLDIKPGNIIMGAPAKLIDLSVARTTGDAAALTTAIGTDQYMAPEQCAPRRPVAPCPASDVWGIGATLFHALTGRRPFERGSDSDAATDAERWPQLVTAPATMPPRVPADVAVTVLACLSTDPRLRPAPAELVEAFEAPMAALPKPRLGGWKNNLR